MYNYIWVQDHLVSIFNIIGVAHSIKKNTLTSTNNERQTESITFSQDSFNVYKSVFDMSRLKTFQTANVIWIRIYPSRLLYCVLIWIIYIVKTSPHNFIKHNFRYIYEGVFYFKSYIWNLFIFDIFSLLKMGSYFIYVWCAWRDHIIIIIWGYIPYLQCCLWEICWRLTNFVYDEGTLYR